MEQMKKKESVLKVFLNIVLQNTVMSEQLHSFYCSTVFEVKYNISMVIINPSS